MARLVPVAAWLWVSPCSHFTCTGTLGLQAALAGLKSVVTESYYSNNNDFIVFRRRDEIGQLPTRAAVASFGEPLIKRQQRIIRNLLLGSFEGDFFSFKGFDAGNPAPSALTLSHALGRRLDQLIAEGRL